MVTDLESVALRRIRLLYVEDDRIHALLFEAALTALPGVEVRVAENGGEALAIATDWRPDVFVLDGHLPDMTGAALLQRLRASFVDAPSTGAPAFMCSADDTSTDIDAARRAGFAGFWRKPVDTAIVAADLATALQPNGALSPSGRLD